MATKPFLGNSDRHDLFEKINEMSHSSEMIDDNVQELLALIDEKLSRIHEEVWDSLITVTVAGSQKSTLMDRLVELGIPGYVTVEINHPGHFIRYLKDTVMEKHVKED